MLRISEIALSATYSRRRASDVGVLIVTRQADLRARVRDLYIWWGGCFSFLRTRIERGNGDEGGGGGGGEGSLRGRVRML